MKKIITLHAFFVLASLTLSAQIKKGSMLLGFDFAFNGTSITQQSQGPEIKNTANSFSGSLLVGQAIKDNVFIGAALSYSSNTFKSSATTNEQKTNGFGGSVWARKYFPVLGPVYAFVNGSVYVNTASNKQTNNSDIKTNTLGLGIAVYPGVSLQLKKSFFLDASLNNLSNIYYNHTKITQPDGGGSTTTQTSNSYGISTSLGNGSNPLQLGIRWIIPGK